MIENKSISLHGLSRRIFRSAPLFEANGAFFALTHQSDSIGGAHFYKNVSHTEASSELLALSVN